MQGVRTEQAAARAWVAMNEPRAGSGERNGEGGLTGTGEEERGSWASWEQEQRSGTTRTYSLLGWEPRLVSLLLCCQ